MALPTLGYPYYWHIVATNGPDVHVRIYLKRRWLGLFRTAIQSLGEDFMILKGGEWDAEQFDQLCEMARNIYETRFSQRDTLFRLRELFPQAKVGKP